MRFSLAHASVLLAAAIGGGWWGGLRGVYTVYAALGAVFVSVTVRLVVSGLPRTTLSDWSVRSLRLPPIIWRFAATLLALAFAAPYATLFVHYTVFRSLGAGSAGYLQAAVGVSLSLRTLLGSAHTVFLTPHVNRQGTADERIVWAHEFQRTTCLLFMVLLPPVLLFPDVAVHVLYTSKFISAAPIAGLFIAAEVLTLLSGTYGALILAGNHLGFHLVQNLVAQGLLAGVAALLLPRLGLTGVGVATLLVPLYLFATTVWYLRRRIGFRMPVEVWRPTLVVATTMLICGIIGSHWRGLSPGLVFAKAGLCALVITASLGVLPSDDRGALRLQLTSLLHKVRPGAPLEDAS